jgi:hypothetical protein
MQPMASGSLREPNRYWIGDPKNPLPVWVSALLDCNSPGSDVGSGLQLDLTRAPGLREPGFQRALEPEDTQSGNLS